MEAKFKEKAEAEIHLKEKTEMKRKAQKVKEEEEMKLKERVEMKRKAAIEAELEVKRKRKAEIEAELEAERRRKAEKVKVAMNLLLEALLMETVLTLYLSPVPVLSKLSVPACRDTAWTQLGNCLDTAEILPGYSRDTAWT